MATDTSYPNTASPPLSSAARLRVSARTWTLLAFAALLILSSGVRLLTYDRYLPFLDYADENNMYLLGRDWRGVEDVPVVPEWLAGYPPLYVWMNIGVQQMVEAVWTGPWLLISDYFYVLRFLAALVGILTTLVVASIAWQLAGALAGWLAGFVWGLAPVIVEHNSLAIPDPIVYLTCALSISMALRAWTKESPRWLVGSLVAAVATIYLKYPAAYILLPWAVVALDMTRRQPRRMLPWLAGMLALGLAAAAYLVFGYQGLRLSNREADTVRSSFFEYLISPSRNLNNAYFALYPIGDILFLVTVLLGAAAYVYARRHRLRLLSLRYIGLLLLYSVAGIMLASTYSNVWLGAGKIRHVLPVSLALIALWSAALVQVVWVLPAFLRHRRTLAGRESLAVAVLLAAVVGVGLLPTYAAGDLELVQRFRRTSIQQVMWRWTDTNIPTDGLILAHPVSFVAHTWNRPWSGYDGVKTFEWWLEDETQIIESTPERYVERGITYFVMDERDQTRYFSTPELSDFVSQLTLVKTFPAAPDIYGDTTYFYRMLPPGHAADADFGGQIRLVGYDLTASALAPGDTLHFRPYWRTVQPPATNYSMFLHVYQAAEDQLVAQYDGAPTVPDRPTLLWDDPGELYIGSDNFLPIPADLSPGDYRLVVGLYDFSTGARLALPGGDTYFTIPLTIQ